MEDEDLEVKHFIKDGQWDVQKLKGVIGDDMVEDIVENVNLQIVEETIDIPW